MGREITNGYGPYQSDVCVCVCMYVCMYGREGRVTTSGRGGGGCASRGGLWSRALRLGQDILDISYRFRSLLRELPDHVLFRARPYPLVATQESSCVLLDNCCG